LIPLF